MTKLCYSPADLLPHAPPMVLIDSLVGYDDTGCRAQIRITPASRFFVGGCGVPSYVGLEYMAQTCGMHVGRRARDNGQKVRIGYLLGTRDFHSDIGWFTDGAVLEIDVVQILEDDPMAVFDCRICCNGQQIVTARLNVYQPPEKDSATEMGQ